MTREEEILTTAGATFFTMPEYPRRAASAERGAVLMVAGGFMDDSAARRPRKPVTASAVPTETVASHRRPLRNLFVIAFATSITSLGSGGCFAHTLRRVCEGTEIGDD